MKTKKLKVRLFPDPGKIIKGAFVFVNNQITLAEEVTTNTVTVMMGNELIEFPKVACYLAKYFGFSSTKRLTGEIAFKDYSLIKDGITIIGEIHPKSSPVEIGDKVRIHKPCLHDLDKVDKCGYEGVVVKATSRKFTIGLISDDTIEIYRDQFQTINKPNYRNIIHVIKIVDK